MLDDAVGARLPMRNGTVAVLLPSAGHGSQTSIVAVRGAVKLARSLPVVHRRSQFTRTVPSERSVDVAQSAAEASVIVTWWSSGSPSGSVQTPSVGVER